MAAVSTRAASRKQRRVGSSSSPKTSAKSAPDAALPPLRLVRENGDGGEAYLVADGESITGASTKLLDVLRDISRPDQQVHHYGRAWQVLGRLELRNENEVRDFLQWVWASGRWQDITPFLARLVPHYAEAVIEALAGGEFISRAAAAILPLCGDLGARVVEHELQCKNRDRRDLAAEYARHLAEFGVHVNMPAAAAKDGAS